MFLDTETSDKILDKDFSSDEEGRLPYLVQLSWLICDENRKEIKRTNYYVNEKDFSSSKCALKIHGIEDYFRQLNGFSRKEVMRGLVDDIQRYKPLIVCHCKAFDLQIIKVELERADIKYDIDLAPVFCTMEATRSLAGSIQDRYFRLDELYAILFYKKIQHHHDALADAQATAACFFELLGSGFITEQTILKQLHKK